MSDISGSAYATYPDFGGDPFPGRPRILFVALAESSHTLSWINLLSEARMNVRLFALPSGRPPADWPVRTYITAGGPPLHPPAELLKQPAQPPLDRLARAVRYRWARLTSGDPAQALPPYNERWLASAVRQWRPHVVHVMGMDPAGHFAFKVRREHGLSGIGRWVLQIRGGSDLALTHMDPEVAPALARMLNDADQWLSDNMVNFRLAREIGVKETRAASIAPVPGAGGVDVAALSAGASGRPSTRRLILWPKAYESPWSKALPVIEALKLAWDRIQPCEIQMLVADRETRQWLNTLPEAIRRACRLSRRIPHDQVLSLMQRARVLLAPSLVDGTPNSLFEAMACGAFPIVSPLDTITPIVESGRNVLLARNLYPQEIAEVLVRAMTEDALVDAGARRNLEAVRTLADRAVIGPRVIAWYEEIAGGGRP